MNTTDSSKVSDANAGANNVIHIPHNPTLAGLVRTFLVSVLTIQDVPLS